MYYKAYFEQAQKDIETVRKKDIRLGLRHKGKPVQKAGVSAEQVAHDFLFGAYLTPNWKFHLKTEPYGNPALIPVYRQRFAELMNLATIGIYWNQNEPEQGRIRFDVLDEELDWCQANRITPKLHPLVWLNHILIPAWVDVRDRASYRNAVERYARSILERYSDRVRYWEVVNEACHWGRTPQFDSIVNEIAWAFGLAREYLPDGHLVINDYAFFDMEQSQRTQILLRVGDLTGIIDGVGFQAHAPRNTWFDPVFVEKVLTHYHERTGGKAIHITELAVSDCEAGYNLPDSVARWNQELQADFAEFFYTFFFSKPQIRQITWWDMCRVEEFAPGSGLCDDKMEPKPVYYRLKKLIHEEWKTRASGVTDENGLFRFRGFAGKYRVIARLANGRELVAEVSAGRESAGGAIQVNFNE